MITENRPADLNSSCQDLSNGGLENVVALLVHQKIVFFMCVSLIGNPAVACADSLCSFFARIPIHVMDSKSDIDSRHVHLISN